MIKETTEHLKAKDGFQRFRFSRDESRKLISIPAIPGTEGYLGVDTEEEQFVQVRLLTSQNEEERSTILDIWDGLWELDGPEENSIFPEMLARGEENSKSFYVATLPEGEPVANFVKRNGPIPAEDAVSLVLRFIEALLGQVPYLANNYALLPNTVWIEKSIGEPEVVLGEITASTHQNPDGSNTELCLELLKFLSGNPPYDEDFRELCEEIAAHPKSLKRMLNLLLEYRAKFPPSEDYWMELRMPVPWLEQINPTLDFSAGEDNNNEKTEAGAESAEESDSNSAKKPARPVLPVLATMILLLGITALIYFKFAHGKVSGSSLAWSKSRKPTEGIVAETAPVPEPLVTKRMIEKSPLSGIEDSDSTGYDGESDRVQSAPDEEKLPGEPVLSPIEVAKPSDQGEIAPDPKQTLSDAKVGSSGEPVAKADQPETEKVEAGEPKEDSPELAERDAAAVAPPQPHPDSATPAADLKHDLLRRVANQARLDGDLTGAIKGELALLDYDPQSKKSKARLREDLLSLQLDSEHSISNDDIDLLERAAVHDDKAFDILAAHYKKVQDWKNEVGALVRHGQRGRPDKLREAGQRTFENPAASDADKARARQWFIDAGNQGDPESLFYAGECLIRGKGGDKDPVGGAELLLRAVARGEARAMDLLGVCYTRSWGVERDDKKAVGLFELAIENGNVASYYNLGARYAQGQGVERDPEKAADLFEQGAKGGDAQCMMLLGRCFENGYGREEDSQKAIYWFSKAAKKGHTAAVEWCRKNKVDYLEVLAKG